MTALREDIDGGLVARGFGDAGLKLEKLLRMRLVDSDTSVRKLAPNTVLLLGPTGSGKSLLVSALADRHSVSLIEANTSELIIKYRGQVHKAYLKLYDEARQLQQKKGQPCIVLMKNLDLYDDFSVQFSIQAFLNAANQNANNRVLIIGTAWKKSRVSSKIRQRFEDVVELLPPTPEERTCVLRAALNNFDLTEVDIERISATCHGFLAADLLALARTAGIESQMRGTRVTSSLLMEAKRGVRISQDPGLTGLRSQSALIRWSDIGGYEQVKEKLQENVVWFYQHADRFKRLGIAPPTGVLLYGPPGTGKTMLARAVATESSANFISVSIPELVKAEIGESERSVEELFVKARQLSPCIMFLDEIEALFGRRDSSGSLGKKLISQLNMELDKNTTFEHKVVVLAATNALALIDHTITRPGRLDQLIYVPPPGAREREAILQVLTKQVCLARDVDIAQVARSVPDGTTGAELRALVWHAYIKALERHGSSTPADKIQITLHDFDVAQSRIQNMLKICATDFGPLS